MIFTYDSVFFVWSFFLRLFNKKVNLFYLLMNGLSKISGFYGQFSFIYKAYVVMKAQYSPASVAIVKVPHVIPFTTSGGATECCEKGTFTFCS